MRLRRARSGWLVVLVGVAVACAAPASTPSARPDPSPAAPGVRDPLEAPWVMTRGAGTFVHTLRLSSELASRVDTVERVDSSTATLRVSWSRLAGSDPARLSGLVTEYGVGAGAVGPQALAGLLLPVPFSATEGWNASQARLEVPASAACGLAATVTSLVRELFVSPPTRLIEGSSWSDSASYELCRDSIPLRIRSVRRFVVVGAERRGSEVLVLVDRTSNVAIEGEGMQFGEPLTITATGTGAMRLELRPAGAVVVTAQGGSELSMTMRGRRRTQELRQHTRIEITSP